MADLDLQVVEVECETSVSASDVAGPSRLDQHSDETITGNPLEIRRNFRIRSGCTRSLPSTLNLRESGLMSKIRYDNSIYEARMKYPNKFRCCFEEALRIPLDLVRTTGSYFFVFRNGSNKEIVRYQYIYEQGELSSVNFSRNYINVGSRDVQDVCGLGRNHMLFVANSTSLDPNSSNAVGVLPVGNDGYTSSFWPVTDMLRCCDYDHTGRIIVVGTAVQLIKIQNCHLMSPINSIKGDIYSIALRNHGSSVLYSESTGNIYGIDFRTKQNDHIVKMRNGIHQIKPIDTEGHEVIVSGYEHQLCLIDMRMKRISREFEGHVNNYRTIPFSYSATNKLLCSSGEDRRTRIWNLDQSNFLIDLPSPNSPFTGITYSFLRENNRWHHLHHFSKKLITIHELSF